MHSGGIVDQKQFVGEMTSLNCGLVYWNMVRAFEHNFLEWLTKHRLELTYTFVGNWEPQKPQRRRWSCRRKSRTS